MMPETPKSVAAVARAIMFTIKDPYARILKVIDQKRGRIVSSGHWILPMNKGDEKQPQGSWRISQSIVIKSSLMRYLELSRRIGMRLWHIGGIAMSCGFQIVLWWKERKMEIPTPS